MDVEYVLVPVAMSTPSVPHVVMQLVDDDEDLFPGYELPPDLADTQPQPAQRPSSPDPITPVIATTGSLPLQQRDVIVVSDSDTDDEPQMVRQDAFVYRGKRTREQLGNEIDDVKIALTNDVQALITIHKMAHNEMVSMMALITDLQKRVDYLEQAERQQPRAE